MSRTTRASLLARLYRATLRWYPADFRRAVGEDLTETFLDRWNATAGRGPLVRAGVLVRSAADVFTNGLAERLAERRGPRHGPADSTTPTPGYHAVRRSPLAMDRILQDLRYAARSLLRTPGFAAVVVLTLALGIGANTAVFSVANAVALRPLPFADPDDLVIVWGSHPEIGLETASYPDFIDWREQTTSYDALAAMVATSMNLTGEGFDAERVRIAYVAGGIFDVLGVYPRIGRAPTAEEDVPGAEPVVVISHGLWQRRFGGEPDVLDRTIELQGRAMRVIGVMPEDFRFPEDVEAWIPFARDPSNFSRRGDFLRVYGRLAPGATVASAQAEMTQLMARLAEEYPATNARWSARVIPLHEEIVGDIRPVLLVFLGAVGFVLLIVCTNVANLALARATRREGEMALRTALGAGRWDLARQLLVEAGVLAAAGGLLGVGAAWVGVRTLVALSPGNIPRLADVGVDATALLFALGVTAVTGLLFGAAPAWSSSRVSGASALGQTDRRSTSGRHGLRARGALIVSEVGIAMVLLVGAGLLMRSFLTLQAQDPGFSPASTLTARLSLPAAAYPDSASRLTFYDRLADDLRGLPGVEYVSYAVDLPMTAGNYLSFAIQGDPVAPPGQAPLQDAVVLTTSGDYFRALDIPLLSGRTYGEQDRFDTEPVAVISESMATRWFPRTNPIGEAITFGNPQASPTWIRIVGVVGDVRNEGLARDSYAQIYLPLSQRPPGGTAVLVSTEAGVDPSGLAGALRRAVATLDGSLPVYALNTLEGELADTIALPRFNFLLITVFAGAAVVLAAIGLYGVMSYSVASRTNEIGIRMALGARQQDVLRQIVGRGTALAAVGAGLGLTAAALLSGTITSMVFGIDPVDPLTYGATGAVLLLVAGIASAVPAYRASRVDPALALRRE